MTHNNTFTALTLKFIKIFIPISATIFVYCVWFVLIELNPAFFLLLPIIAIISHSGEILFFKMISLVKFYSPMLLVFKSTSTYYKIHNRSLFDFLIIIKWKNRGYKNKNQMLIY